MFSLLRHLIRFCFSYVYIAHATWFNNKIWCRFALSHISFFRQQSQLNPIQINNDHILFNQSNLVYRAKCCIVDFEWMTWRQQWKSWFNWIPTCSEPILLIFIVLCCKWAEFLLQVFLNEIWIWSSNLKNCVYLECVFSFYQKRNPEHEDKVNVIN